MQIAKTLIRLGRCPGWSESSLGAQSFCWFCHEAAHFVFNLYYNSFLDITILVNVKALEVIYNALESAFTRTRAGEKAICLSEHDSTLFVIKHAARIIDKIAVYDIATSFTIHLIHVVYSVNHKQVEYKRLRFGNFTHASPKWQFSIFLEITLPAFNETIRRHAFYIVTVFSTVLKYIYLWFSSTMYRVQCLKHHWLLMLEKLHMVHCRRKS